MKTNRQIKKFPLFIRIIATILLVTFLVQDIAWAHPDPFTKDPSRHATLAPEPMFDHPEDKVTAISTLLQSKIESHGVFKGNVSLTAVEHILDLEDISKWCDENKIAISTEHTFTGKPTEIRLVMPHGRVLRYYDPNIKTHENKDTAARGTVVRINANLSKQAIESNDFYKKNSQVGTTSTHVDLQAAIRKEKSSAHISPFQKVHPSLYERISNYGLIAVSAGLILAYWLIDTIAYMYVFSDSDVLSALMPSDPYRYFTRAVTACMIFLFGSVIQFFVNRNKKRSIALSERNHMFFQVFMDMGVAAHRLDISGNILDVNTKWCEWMGYKREEVIDRPIFDFIDPEHRGNARDRLLGRIRGFTEVEIPQRTGDRRYIRKDGTAILSDTFHTILKDRFGRPIEILTQFRDITEQRSMEKELEKSLKELKLVSDTDKLTGAYSRNFWDRQFNAILEAFSRTKIPISAIMCDLDDFKIVNDTHGHATGDEVLKEYARVMLADRRKTDFVIRAGDKGDEFIIILFNTDAKGASIAANRILENLATDHNVLSPDGKPISIRASMGVAQFREGQTKEDLVKAADEALYIAKQSGKSKVVVTAPSSALSEGDASPESKMAFKRVVENIRTKPRKYSDITISEKFISNMAEIRNRLRKLGIEDILGDLRDLRVLTTDAVVLGHGDFSVGFYSKAEDDKNNLISVLGEDGFNKLFPRPTLVLPREMFDEYDELIQQDYILHRIICHSKGHHTSMFIQQAVYPENYNYGAYEEEAGKKYMPGCKGDPSKPFKGRTGEAIQNIINAITKDPITTVIMHDLKNKIQGGYVLDLVLNKYKKDGSALSEDLLMLKKYRDMMGSMGKTTLSFYANGANETEAITALSDMLPELKKMTTAIKLKLRYGAFDYDMEDKEKIAIVIKNSEEGVVPGINTAINMLGRSPEEIDVGRFIEDIISRAKSIFIIPENTRVDLSIPSEVRRLSGILTYKLILKLTLEELLKNASVDGQANRIKVSVSATSEGELKVMVRDYGKGMSEESLKRLFMPGNAAVEDKRYGSGYGLAVLKEAIDSVGGTIIYDNKVTDGPSFTFTLPLDAPLDKLKRRALKEPLMVAMCGRRGSGRSTVGRMIAATFGLRYVNSGFILRAVLYKLIEAKKRGSPVDLGDPKAVGAFAQDFFEKKRIDYSKEPVGIDGVDSASILVDGLSLRDKIKMLISNKEFTDGQSNEEWMHRVAGYKTVDEALENFIRTLAVETKAYGKYNGIIRMASDPVKNEDIINIMLDAPTYIRAKRSNTPIEEIEKLDSATGRKSMTGRYARVDMMIDTAHLTVRQAAIQAIRYIDARVLSKEAADGFISQGDAAFTRMAENIASGKVVDATHDPRIVLDIERLKNRLGLRSIDDLMGAGSAVRILVTNDVVINEKDFALGLYSESPAVKARLIQVMGEEKFKLAFPRPTLVLTTEVLLNKDENIRQEYIYHEAICHAKGHYEAILAQQKVFPKNYTGDCEEGANGLKYVRGFAGVKDKPFKGRLGSALTATIKMATDPIIREVLHDLNSKFSTAGGFALYSVLKRYSEEEIEADKRLKLLKEYCALTLELRNACIGYLSGEATMSDVMDIFNEHLKRFTSLTSSITERFNNNEYNDTERSKNGMKVLVEYSGVSINLMNRAMNWIGRSMDSVDVEGYLANIIGSYRASLKESATHGNKYVEINDAKISPEARRLKDIFTYKEVLRMTIEELVKNALKYSGTDSIDIEASLTKDGDLEFKVIDHGKGIPADTLKKLFTPGFTEAKDSRIGTGYGLVSLKDAIGSVGGSINVESKVGEGTTFIFTLPANGEIGALNRPKLYDPIIVAVSGLRGSGRTVVSRWIASRLGLRYINPRFMMRAMVATLLEARKNGRAIDLKDGDAVAAFAEEFFGKRRLDYSVEPVKLDGVDTSVPDEKDGLSLRDKIKTEIDDGITDGEPNTTILDNIAHYKGVQAALEKFIKSIASEVRASGKYNGVIRPGTEPVKDNEVINIMLDASSYIRASRANRGMDWIASKDELTDRKNMADKHPYIDIIDTSYSTVEETGARALGYIMGHIPITDGMVRKGDKAFRRMVGNVIAGNFAETGLMVAPDLENVAKITGASCMEELIGSDKPLRVLVTNAVVLNQSDFSFGFYSHAPPIMAKIISLVGEDTFNSTFPEPTLILSAEILANPSPQIRQEHILHEIFCHTKGHSPAVFEEQRLFPGNYSAGTFEERGSKKYIAGYAWNEAMPFDGAFGDALRQVIDKKLATTTTGEFARPKGKEHTKTSAAFMTADLIAQAEKLKTTSMQEQACALILKALSIVAESDQPVPYENIANIRAFIWDERSSGHVPVNFDVLLPVIDEYMNDCNLTKFRIKLSALRKHIESTYTNILAMYIYKQLSHLFFNSLPTITRFTILISSRKYPNDPSLKEMIELSSEMDRSMRNLGDESNRLRSVDSLMNFLTVSDESLSRQRALLDAFRAEHPELLRLDSRLRGNIEAINAELEKLARARSLLALTLGNKPSLEEIAERVDLVVAKMETGVKTPRIAWVGGLVPYSNTLSTVKEGEPVKVSMRVYIPGFTPQEIDSKTGIKKFAEGFIRAEIWTNAISDPEASSVEAFKPIDMRFDGVGGREGHDYIFTGFIPAKYASQIDSNGRPKEFRFTARAAIKNELGGIEGEWAYSDNPYKTNVNWHGDGRIVVLSRDPEEDRGNLVGRVFSDTNGKDQVTHKISGRIEKGFLNNDYLVLYGEDGKVLYAKDGKEARVKLESPAVKTDLGYIVYMLEPNDHIHGFASRDKVFMADFMFYDRVLSYHEMKEAYYSVHPDEVPEGIEPHTYLRGCGKGIRNTAAYAVRYENLDKNFTAGQLKTWMKNSLAPEDRGTDSEMRLIEHNASKGKKGMELLYGEQDRVFGPKANMRATEKISGKIKNRNDYSLSRDKVVLVVELMKLRPEAFPNSIDATVKMLGEGFDVFKKYDFQGHTPVDAAHYHSDYKKWHGALLKLIESDPSVPAHFDSISMSSLLEALRDQYGYINAKLNWAWAIEGMWKDTLDGMEKYPRESQMARFKGLGIFKRHDDFMKDYAGSYYIENDDAVNKAMKAVEETLGFINSRVPSIFVKDEKPDGSAPVAAIKKNAPLGERAINFMKSGRASEIAQFVALAFIISIALSWVLPANWLTLSIAIIVPITLFFLLPWTWKTLLVNVAISVVLWYWLPLPWFGLSMAILTIANVAKHNIKLKPHLKPEAVPAERSVLEEKKAEKILSDITIDREILARILKAIEVSKEGTDKADANDALKKLDDADIITQLFDFGSGTKGYEKPVKETKEKLRLGVRRAFDDIKGGLNIEYKDMIERLKNWKNENDEALAGALQDLSQEVMDFIINSNHAADNKVDRLAVRELIAEECGIDAARSETIRLRMALDVQKDDVASNEMIGSASANDHFFLAALQLKFGNYIKAEESFGRAVDLDPTNADYRLALGLVEHIFRKWMAARTAYNAASNFYDIEAGVSKAAKAKKELAEFLREKARAEAPLIMEKKTNGNLIGKLFIDKAATVQIKEGVIAKEEMGILKFFAPNGDILYTKSGVPAAVKLTGQIIKTKSGHQIKIVEDNEHIRGFADKDNAYLADSFAKNPIAKYHELQESHYAAHPEELPKGVNSHTYIRGCGNDAREALRTSRKKDLQDITADDLIKYLKKRLPKERHNENEFNLIRYNGEQGRKGLDLIYGLQDREFGVEANELFSDALIILEKPEPAAQAAPKTQLRTADEVLFRDYFEDLFEKNIEMFMLLSVRMMGSDAEKKSVLKRRNALVQELLALTDKYRSQDFAKEEYRKVVTFVNEKILRTVELVDGDNEPAAAWCLFGAINVISDTRLEMQAKWLSGIKERRARIWRNGGILTYPRGGYRILEGSKRTVIDRTEATFSSMWEVMRSLFHQVDGELEEKRKVSGLIYEIDGFMLELFDKNYELNDDERAAMSKKIGLLAASMAKEKGELKYEDKRIAKLLLNASGMITRLGDRHLKSVKGFLEMAMSHLRIREADAISIATHCNNSGLNWVWVESLKRDSRIRNLAISALKSIERKDRRSALGAIKGITRLNEIKNEPEYKPIYNILWPVVKAIEENKKPLESAIAPLNLVLEKYNNSRLLHNMLREYRDKLVEKEMASLEPIDRDAFLKDIFDMSAKQSDFPKTPNPVQARARWWAKLHQAVNIPLMIDDPVKRGERIPNPVFEAASDYAYILEFGKLDELVKMPFMQAAKLGVTRPYLENILKRRPYSHLIRTDMPNLVAALSKDYGLDPDQARLLDGCIRIEEFSGATPAVTAGPQVPSIVSPLKVLDGMRITDEKRESFRLRIGRSLNNNKYSDTIFITRESDGESVGMIETIVAEDSKTGSWSIELGLAKINQDVKGTNYRNRGIFLRVMNLLGKVIPEGSEMSITSVEETRTLKTLAGGKSWYQTMMGKTLYRSGWKLQELFIFDRGSSSTYVSFDRLEKWKSDFPVDKGGFQSALAQAIKDIDKTDAIDDATVGAVLSKIDRSAVAEGKARIVQQADKGIPSDKQLVWINIHGFVDQAKGPLEKRIRESIAKQGLIKNIHDVSLGVLPDEVRSHVKSVLEDEAKPVSNIVLSGHFFATISEYPGCIESAIRGVCDALGTSGYRIILPLDLIDNSDETVTPADLVFLLGFTQLDKENSLVYIDDAPVAKWSEAKADKGAPVEVRLYTTSEKMKAYLEKNDVSAGSSRAPESKTLPVPKESPEILFARFMSKADMIKYSAGQALEGFRPGEFIKEKGLILYADSILEHGAVAELEDALKNTGIFNEMNIVVYGKKPGMAWLLEKIIRGANSTVNVITVSEADLIEKSGTKEIYIDETKELDSIIKYAGAKGINNGNLLGVIKGSTAAASIGKIRELLSERKVPVVSFESADGVYSFAAAIGILAKLKNNIDPKMNNYFAVLPPIKKLSIELDRTYREYREALKKLLSSA